jgi:4-amino-4-deoxy-L-arabinose transferase-like glycosyltransferase
LRNLLLLLFVLGGIVRFQLSLCLNSSFAKMMLVAIQESVDNEYFEQARGFLYRLRYPLIGDEFEYAMIGLNLAEGRGYSKSLGPPFDPTARRSPLLPLLLTVLIISFGNKVYYGIIVNALLSALTALPIFHIARRLGGTTAGYISAALWLAWPNGIAIGAGLLTEPLYTLLGSLAALELLALQRNPGSNYHAVAAGGLVALGALTRAEMLLFPAFLLFFFLGIRRTSLRHRIKLYALFVVAFSFVYTPWVVRNALTFGRFLPGTTVVGQAFAGAHCPDTEKECPGGWFGEDHSVPENRRQYFQQLDEVQQSQFLVSKGLSYVKEMGLKRFARLELLKLFWFWVPYQGLVPKEISPWANKVLSAVFLPCWIGFVLGLYHVARRKVQEASPLLVLIVFQTSIALVFWGSYRFRAVLEPAVLVFCGVWYSHLWERMRRRRCLPPKAPRVVADRPRTVV